VIKVKRDTQRGTLKKVIYYPITIQLDLMKHLINDNLTTVHAYYVLIDIDFPFTSLSVPPLELFREHLS